MKLELWCDGVDFLKKAGRLFPSAQGGRAYKITSIRPQGQMALLQLEGVNDMDAARALRGQVFYFDRNDATLPEGRWYVADPVVEFHAYLSPSKKFDTLDQLRDCINNAARRAQEYFA